MIKECKKNSIALVVFGFLLSLFLYSDGWAKNNNKIIEEIGLRECTSKDFNFKILCNQDWPVEKTQESIKLTVAHTKLETVTVTVNRPEEKGLKLTDLTPSALQYVYKYANDFKYSVIRLKGQKAVRVIGQPVNDPNGYLLDYYFIRDSMVYRVSFYTRPVKAFNKYATLFLELLRSFEFI